VVEGLNNVAHFLPRIPNDQSHIRLSEEMRFGMLVGFGVVPQSHNVLDDVRSPRIAGFQCCHLTRRHGDSRFFGFVSPK